jgi:pimeloyl-ACP methyl ester carboxylesterase
MSSLVAWGRTAALAAELSGRPGLGHAVRAVTPEPRVLDVDAGGVPATLAVPSSSRPQPGLVFVGGVTARGRAHPLAQRFARGLARAGIVTLVPDPAGLSTGELTDATVGGVAAAAEWLSVRPEVGGGRVGLAGVSLGTTLGLLAAERPVLASRVSVVAGIAPYTSLHHVIRAGTTGCFVDAGRPFPYPTSSFLSLVVGRSVIANLTSDEERDRLRPLLIAVADDDPDPLAALRPVDRAALGTEARAALDLLANRDPEQFDDRFTALPQVLRDKVDRLSPILRADALAGVPVELASAPQDAYFPLSEPRALLEMLPRARLTVTGALAHAIPSPALRRFREIASFAAFIARVLSLVAAGAKGSRTRPVASG